MAEGSNIILSGDAMDEEEKNATASDEVANNKNQVGGGTEHRCNCYRLCKVGQTLN